MVPVVDQDPLAPSALPTPDSYTWFSETHESRAPSWRNETGDGFASALADRCPNQTTCWQGCRDRVSRKAKLHGLPGEDGSIFFPWIGLNYRPGGICLAGWNLNHAGSDWFPLTEEHVIARASRKKLANGHRKVWGSLFAYRSICAAAAVHDALRGAEPVAPRRPEDAAGYFDEIARVQTVKCAPRGDRSNPTSAMNANCPPTFLLAELEILQPRVLIIFGRAAREAALIALRALDQDDPRWSHKTSGGYGRRQSRAPWGPLDLLGLWHPTYAQWPHAFQTMIADLAADPLHPAAGPVT